MAPKMKKKINAAYEMVASPCCFPCTFSLVKEAKIKAKNKEQNKKKIIDLFHLFSLMIFSETGSVFPHFLEKETKTQNKIICRKAWN